MVPRVIFILLSLIFLYLTNTSHSQQNKLQAFLLPVIKDKTSNTYYIFLSIGLKELKGRSLTPINVYLAIDLNAAEPVVLNCATAAKSPSYHPIRCASARCKSASPESFCPKSTIKKSTLCQKYVWANGETVKSKLIRDTVSLWYTTNGDSLMDNPKDTTLTLNCVDDDNMTSLPSVVSGTIGLAKTPLSLPSQLFSMHNIAQKISICLPSKPGTHHAIGDIRIGGGPYYYAPYPNDVSTFFASTPLIPNPSGEYFIDVKSIEVSGKTIPLDTSILSKTAKICTVVPYTILHTSIYKALVIAFSEASKLVKVPAVKPFGACFSSKGLGRVPVIEFVLKGGAKWRIYGSNSLVKIRKAHVVCLGFLDGVNLKIAMVLGGFQLEDNLVEFDRKASKFSFTSSLLLRNTSCNYPSIMF